MLFAQLFSGNLSSVLLAGAADTATLPLAPPEGFFPEHFWYNLVSTSVFGLLGIVLVLLAIALFDKVSIAKVSLHDELKNGNMAVAVVLSALILGMCFLITQIVK